MTQEQTPRHIHIVTLISLSEHEYEELTVASPDSGTVAALTGSGTVAAAIRIRLGWPEKPYGHSRNPEMMTISQYRLYKGHTT